MEKLNIFDEKKVKNNLKNFLNNNLELKIYSSLDSTNNKAKEYIEKIQNNKINSKKITVFAADIQEAGRGRRGHSWSSDDPASVSVSFLFKAECELDQIPQITAATALAIKETLKKFQMQGQLKWPNDILINNKKICGILSELVFDKELGAFVVIGCGINLNNYVFNSEIEKLATSYYLEKGKKIDKNLFLAELIPKMVYYIKGYLNDRRKNIINKWKDQLNLIGKKVDLNYKGKDYTVIIKDILDSGELLANFNNGAEKKLQSLNTSLDYQSLCRYNDID